MRPYYLLSPAALLKFGIVAIAIAASTASPLAMHAADSANESTESRIRALYERNELGGKAFTADWLDDSSGYIVQERDGDAGQVTRHVYDTQSGQPRTGDSPPDKNRLLSPDKKYILEFSDGDLFVRTRADGQRVQLTQRDKSRDIFYREPAWSPESDKVLFIESDETNVRQRPVLVPSDPSYPEVRENRFARVGETIASLRVGVADLQGKSITWLPLESPAEGFYLGQVEWTDNNQEILVETLSRFRNRREFLLADLDSGKLRSIFTETNDAWAVGSRGKNTGLIWVRQAREFIVISEKDGWRHAFLYSREGQELALLTPGDYDIIERGSVDEQNGNFYFYASPDNATQKYLYRVSLDGAGKHIRVTPDDQPGTHEYKFSPDANWAFHTFSAFDTPPVTELVELPSHRRVRILEDNKELHDRARQWITHKTEFLQLQIDDKVSVDAWMIKPKDFDASRKYPVFVYVYGEPYSQTVLDSWGAAQAHFHRVVADLGYLVVSIDNRGTPAPKGAAWRRSIFGSLGPISTEEQAAALHALARTHAYVDLSRVGIWGWSGGGSNTLNAMFRKPELYRVGIAVVPKPQPHLYNAWFQEIYMRTREVNAEGYERSAPINFAEGLQGKLLILTGSGETNTHIQIIEGLVDRLIELGKPFDYMVYPNRDHGLREGSGTLIHVRMLIIRYLTENLPPGPQ